MNNLVIKNNELLLMRYTELIRITTQKWRMTGLSPLVVTIL